MIAERPTRFQLAGRMIIALIIAPAVLIAALIGVAMLLKALGVVG